MTARSQPRRLHKLHWTTLQPSRETLPEVRCLLATWSRSELAKQELQTRFVFVAGVTSINLDLSWSSTECPRKPWCPRTPPNPQSCTKMCSPLRRFSSASPLDLYATMKMTLLYHEQALIPLQSEDGIFSPRPTTQSHFYFTLLPQQSNTRTLFSLTHSALWNHEMCKENVT